MWLSEFSNINVRLLLNLPKSLLSPPHDTFFFAWIAETSPMRFSHSVCVSCSTKMKNCRMKNSRSQLPFCQQQHNTANRAVVALLVTCLSFSHRKTINVSTLFLPEHDADRPIIISCNKSECYCCCLKIAHTAETLSAALIQVAQKLWSTWEWTLISW